MQKLLEIILGTTIDNIHPSLCEHLEAIASKVPFDVDESIVKGWIAGWVANNPDTPLTNWREREEELRKANEEYARTSRKESRKARREALQNSMVALDAEFASIQEDWKAKRSEMEQALAELDIEDAKDDRQ